MPISPVVAAALAREMNVFDVLHEMMLDSIADLRDAWNEWGWEGGDHPRVRYHRKQRARYDVGLM